ncbi:hypothetical protein CVT91_10480 [Candidatus Atribacteria bacterium HGW-Atribacteria-1]|nr:MAG: hypothetical protein CVT91_10480 [Candidatus Atribacteria bacterium HGW-Atribacteria-1]
MWLTALVGMTTKMCEATLGVKYRIKDKDGVYSGGPMYFIEKGLGQKWLGWAFAFFGAICAFGIGDMCQTNSMALVGNSVFKIPVVVTGIVLTFLVWIVIVGGIKRIGEVTEKLVPFMAAFYIVGALIIIISKINLLPWAFGEIFRSAFTGRAAFGGFAGATVAQAMRYGVARGIFSNEAGLGSAGIVHAVAQRYFNYLFYDRSCYCYDRVFRNWPYQYCPYRSCLFHCFKRSRWTYCGYWFSIVRLFHHYYLVLLWSTMCPLYIRTCCS